MIDGRSYRDEEALLGRARCLTKALRRNEEEPAVDGCFGLTVAEQGSLGPLESLPPESCPQERADRTGQCPCATPERHERLHPRKHLV